MKLILLALVFVVVNCQFPDNYKQKADLLIDNALTGTNFSNFEYLCDTFGPRYRGTPNLEGALAYISSTMREQNFDSVVLESVVNITNWIRGTESLTLLSPRRASLSILGLGSSIGGLITAEVFVVSSLDDLKANATKARGKIVLFNVPFTTYGQTVFYRAAGAAEAAKVGGLASLVRSVTPYSLYTTHTGGQNYEDGVTKIPSASITVEDSEMMARMQARGQQIVVQLSMGAHTEMTSSYNILADVKGQVEPQEIIVIGGHSDSWDVGQGAIDDGGGLFAAWEAARIILDLVRSGQLPRPRRTIRVVLWVDEELDQRGAITYAENQLSDIMNHVLAIESDSGNFEPTGFGFSGTPNATAIIKQIGTLLSSIGAGNITSGGQDTDNSYLGALGVPCGSLRSTGFGIDGYYFYFHHSQADTITHIHRPGFRQSVAAMAVMAYVVADMDQRLPFGIQNEPNQDHPFLK